MISLANVANTVSSGESFSVALGNFLDAFYRLPDEAKLRDEPATIAVHVPRALEMDAYLAAAAERLARLNAITIPNWVYKPNRYLHVPSFGSDAASLRATLLLESPPEFRTRNIFVTGNVLTRASQHHGHAA